MSKTRPSFLPLFAASLLILRLFSNAESQDLQVKIQLDSPKQQTLTIQGQRSVDAVKPTSRNLSFLTSIAGVNLSGERISKLKLFNSKGDAVAYKRFAPGEYVAEAEFAVWKYQVDVTIPKNQTLMTRSSWMTKTSGILMLDDLLPQFRKNENIRSAAVVFDLPRNTSGSQWTILSSVGKMNYFTFGAPDISKYVLYLKGDEEPPTSISAFDLPYSRQEGVIPLNLMMYPFGEFQFDQNNAMDTAVEIYQHYRKRFGDEPLPVMIAIGKFPENGPHERWEADTRGRNVTIFTSDALFKSQALQQLHEQLRHEMFHLWIPNGVNLSGNYDWFYEGFALYQSLKTGVALNRIRFDDYLDTLSRAYEVDKRLRRNLSLIEASKHRWIKDNNTLIYARGMLVAFLCDLALLEKSKGKRSVTDLLRKLYESRKPPNPETDGNAAVLKLLGSYSELTSIIDRNITGSESIEWSDLLKGAGLEAELIDQTTKLKVIAKPSVRQKDLLDKLGYNNWRKLASK